jgi:hypothetical protein
MVGGDMRHPFNFTSTRRIAAIGALAIGIAGVAHAQYNSDNPMFPGPGVSFEITSTDTIDFNGLLMTNATFFGFDNSLAYSAIQSGTTTLNEDVTFDANLGGVATVFTGTETLTITPESGTSGGLGTYDTAITAMHVTSGNDVLALGNGSTTGQAIVSLNNGGGGTYHVSSFFDVFTELSLNGGSTYTQGVGGNANGSSHFNDAIPAATPEPITIGLGIVGLGAALRLRRRS